MLYITEARIRRAFEEAEINIVELSLCNDPATHDKYNVQAEVNGVCRAHFIHNEDTLRRAIYSRVEDKMMRDRAVFAATRKSTEQLEEEHYKARHRHFRTSTTLQSPPAPRKKEAPQT
jgi:hypothetical protein